MKLLEEFVRMEVDEGKKLNAALALSMGLAVPEIRKSTLDRPEAQTKMVQSASDIKVDKKRSVPDGGVNSSKDTGSDAEDDVVSLSKAATKKHSKQELLSFVKQAADESGVSPAFIDAIIRTESNYNPRAVSPKNAQGIMQVIPSTAKMIGLNDPFDPEEAIPAATRHLADLLRQFNNDYELAAAAYNAGAGAVKKYGGIPPYAETELYVSRVIERMKSSPLAEPEAVELEF